MSRTIRGLLLTASVAAMAFAANAEQSVEDRIAALEAMVAELKAELAAEKADTDADIVRIETAASEAPAAAAAPKTDGFLVGDTTLKFGGIVDLDVHATSLSDGSIASTSIARDFYIPSATPIGGEGTDFTDFTAESSRFFFSASKPAGEGTVEAISSLISSLRPGNELVSNSYSPRLRRAYVKYGNWLAGQEWSTFQNTSAIPESASFLILSDGMIFIRQPQIRYTKGNWMFALENPNTTTLNAGSRDENIIPDVVARYNWSGDFGNVSLAGIARQLRADFGASEDEPSATASVCPAR